jgi:ATP phosphoribosyltransferase
VISETQKIVEKTCRLILEGIDEKNKKLITQSKENSQDKVPSTNRMVRDNLKVIESQKKPILVIDSDEIFFSTTFKEKFINEKLDLEFTEVKVVIDETKYFFDKVTPITDIEYGYDSKKYYSYSFLNDVDAKVYSQSIAC